ncbi:DUF305 domain-containing protein [Streptomyces sp. SCSIO 30461]|uniref:DUF305 domain-containing protein n=1 Tax=Streptomyces sp. SCSIO 30461 TaxID=3118085 RepID=UPI0030CBCF11
MSTHRGLIRRAAAVAMAGTAVAVLAACGSNDQGPSGQSAARSSVSPTPSASASAVAGAHGAPDVVFAQGMIPHHRQAVTMAELAASRAGSTEVRQLAEQIRKAQAPEIETLSGWLVAWGEQVPADGAGMGHAAHSEGGSAGMMTADEMDELGKSSGPAFDTAFMKLMIKHHEGAVAMARSEQADGVYQPAKEMAEDIVSSQTAEITRMKELLGPRQ